MPENTRGRPAAASRIDSCGAGADDGSLRPGYDDRGELAVHALDAERAAYRAKAERTAKYKAMRESGHRAQVAHVYRELVTVEMMSGRPKTLRELAARCSMPTATFNRVVAVLEEGGWVTRTRGGGRGNPTVFTTAIGRPVPPRPGPKSGAQRHREWYWRQKANAEVSHNLTGNDPQRNGRVSHNLTGERGTIQPEPNATPRYKTAGQLAFYALIGSDPSMASTEVAGSAPAEGHPTLTEGNRGPNEKVSHNPATAPPNPIAADPDAGAGSVKDRRPRSGAAGVLDGFCHGTDNPVAGSGGTGPASLHGSAADNEGGRTVPKYMGDGLLCVGGCGLPARRACCTCWEHALLELGHAREDCPGYLLLYGAGRGRRAR